MGCWYPLREIVSKALGKCNGHERWREEDQRMDYAMAYPPAQTHYMRPVARTVTFSGTNSVHMIPPNPQQGPPPHQQQAPAEPQQSQAPPPPQNEPDHHQQQPEQPAPAPEQGAPPQGEQPRRGKKKPPRRVRFGPDQQPPPPQQEETQQQQQQPEHAPGHQGHGGPHGGNAPGGHHQQQGHGPHGPPGYFRYTPSPLPRWEATPRRHEYFSGEYRHSYPTPVREGIYSLATDANRLTTIFSEENPNACAIV